MLTWLQSYGVAVLASPTESMFLSHYCGFHSLLLHQFPSTHQQIILTWISFFAIFNSIASTVQHKTLADSELQENWRKFWQLITLISLLFELTRTYNIWQIKLWRIANCWPKLPGDFQVVLFFKKHCKYFLNCIEIWEKLIYCSCYVVFKCDWLSENPPC